jgi:hypothetical protein
MLTILFIGIERPTKGEPEPVGTTASQEQPITAGRFATRILSRLVRRTIVPNNVAFVVNSRGPFANDGQLSVFSISTIPTGLTIKAALSVFAIYPITTRSTWRPRLTVLAVLAVCSIETTLTVATGSAILAVDAIATRSTWLSILPVPAVTAVPQLG